MSIGAKENKSVEGLLTFLNERPVVFDCGSNKGDWSKIILNRFGDDAEMHLFEPNAMLLNYTRIEYQRRFNFRFNEIALYKENTNLKFYYFENYNNELSSIYNGGEEWKELPMKEREVVAETLDSYCDRHKIHYIDYLKVDTEGADPDVMKGALPLMRGNRIGVIQVEYGAHYVRANHTFDEVLAMAEETGYDVYYWNGVNYVKVKRSEFIEDFRAEDFFITKWNIPDYSRGWNKEFIINTCELPKFDFCLEVGSFEGITSKFICENMLNPKGRLVCVDPLEDYYTKEDTEHVEMFKNQYQRFLRNTFGLPVELTRKPSEVALPEMHELRYDFIYVDANHGEREVYNDCVNSFKICKVGGYILMDDFEWREETKKGITAFLVTYTNCLEVIIKGYQVLVKKIKD